MDLDDKVNPISIHFQRLASTFSKDGSLKLTAAQCHLIFEDGEIGFGCISIFHQKENGTCFCFIRARHVLKHYE